MIFLLRIKYRTYLRPDDVLKYPGASGYAPGSKKWQPVRKLAPAIALLMSCLLGVIPTFAQAQTLPPPESKLPKYQNLDSILNRVVEEFEQHLTEQHKAQSAAHKSSVSRAQAAAKLAPITKGDAVAVTFYTDSAARSQSLANWLQSRGGDPRNIGEDYVEAYVPIALLAEAAKQPGVRRVQAIVPPQPDLGPVTSQGVAVHRASAWHAAGFTGRGVKVGIIDLSFGRFRRLQGTELPTSVTVRCYTDIGSHTSDIRDCVSGNTHGTAVAESLVDIAPSVSLYIADPISRADLKSTVEWMANQGVKVINHSVSWPWDGPGDGTSPYSNSPLKTVDTAVENGIVWVNSAGNQADRTWYGAFRDTDDNGWHEFSGTDECNSIGFVENGVLNARLRWDDVWGGASRDLNLHFYEITDGGPEERDSSTVLQNGDDDPYESIRYIILPGFYCLGVSQAGDTAAPSWLQLQVRLGGFEYTTLGSIVNPAESANTGMLAVGAAPHSNTRRIEFFSSQGPTPDGRIKPDLVGADRGNTESSNIFSGTSQASPHVAGLAALVRQRFPSYTPQQVTDYLKEQAEPRGTPDPNNTWGHGFAQLPALATLSGISLSVGTLIPDFAPATAGYQAGVASNVTGLTIAATALASSDIFTISPADVDSATAGHQVSLIEGRNIITIIVRTADSAFSIYTVTVTRAAGVIVDPTSLSLIEGTSGTYTVTLGYAPTNDVTVSIASDNTDVTATTALTFTTDNWSNAQTVTVTTAQDTDALNDTATLTHTVSGLVTSAGNVTVGVADDEASGICGRTRQVRELIVAAVAATTTPCMGPIHTGQMRQLLGEGLARCHVLQTPVGAFGIVAFQVCEQFVIEGVPVAQQGILMVFHELLLHGAVETFT